MYFKQIPYFCIIIKFKAMTPSELLQIANEIFDTNPTIDAMCEPGEYDIYTNVWFIDMDALDRLRSKVQVLNVWASEYKLNIRVKI